MMKDDVARKVWLERLRMYERGKVGALRPDRYDECIKALKEEGQEQGWM